MAALHQESKEEMTVSDSLPSTAVVDRLKPLWVFLTGSAFVTFAGGALTYLYFWTIGGMPIGQAGVTGSIIKVVMSSAALLGCMLFMSWLAPTIAFRLFADEALFKTHVSPWFAGNVQHSVETGEKLAWRRVMGFSMATVGIGCVGITLGVSFAAANSKWSWWPFWTCMAIAALGIGWALHLIWKKILAEGLSAHGAEPLLLSHNKAVNSRLATWRSLGSIAKQRVSWLLWGYSCAVLSLFPLFFLLLIFFRTDYLLKLNSVWYLAFGLVVISAGILFSFCTSLVVLVRSTKGWAIQWLFVMGINAFVLSVIVMLLGMSSRMLEAVMKMSSLRVENAVMLLEPEGCEILESMQAIGWGRGPGTPSKTCMLYDVTIQSTLEPAMQIACWRGILNAEHTAPVLPASQDAHALRQHVQVAGRSGSFSIPTEYVRSVWKTAGLKPQQQPWVCPAVLALTPNSMTAASP